MRHASQDDVLADVRARLSLIEGHEAMADPGGPEDVPVPIGRSQPRHTTTIRTAAAAAPSPTPHDRVYDALYASVAEVYAQSGARCPALSAHDRTAERMLDDAPLHEARHRPARTSRDEDQPPPIDQPTAGRHERPPEPATQTRREPAPEPTLEITAPASLAAPNGDPTLDVISQRLLMLEEKLEAVFNRTMDAKPATDILDRMDELKSQYHRVADEIARLEVIEDNLARLIDEVAQRQTDNSLIAESVAERVMTQMGEQAFGPAPAVGGHDRLDGLEQMLSSYVSDRQAEDGSTQHLLEAIRSLVETLDARVGVIEHEIQQATAPEMPASEPAAISRDVSFIERAAEDERTHVNDPVEIDPEALAGFDYEDAMAPVAAPEEPRPATRGRRAKTEPDHTEATSPRSSTREQLIASARRAAQAATVAAPAPKRESLTKRLMGGDKAEAPKGRKAEAPQVSNRVARIALDKKSPRPVVILAVLALVLAGAGLIYGKLTRKPAGPTIKIESPANPQKSKANEAGPATDKQSMIDDAWPETDRDLATGSSTTVDADLLDVTSLSPAEASFEGPDGDYGGADVVGAVSDDMPPEGLAPLAARIKAANGDPVAQHQIASQFARGALGKPDMAMAAVWYGRAAEAGYAPAQYQLASLLQRGTGIEQNLAEARAWYGKAIAAGNIKAAHNLAVMLTSEEGGPRDYAASAKLFKKAADHGLADSQFNLAILHENGLGVKRSTTEAYRWFSLAAAAGDQEADRRRQAIKQRLSPALVSKIDTELKTWSALPIADAANAVPGLPAEVAATAEPAAADDATKPADVALVQDLLKALGYEVGRPGVLDARTSDAITSFETRSKLPATGRVSEELIQRLMSLAG